jgi:hypothetical protein
MTEPQTAIPTNRSALDAALDVAVPVSGEVSNEQVLTLSSKLLEALKWSFSFPAMLGMGIVGRVFYEARKFFIDPDLWWHIKVGEDILHTHHFPTTDPYSWSVAGQPWIAYEWLGEVAIALVKRAGGVLALDAFLIIFSSIIMLLIYSLASMRAANSKAGFVSAGILCSIAFGSFTLRPQMFGSLFLVLTLIILLKFRKGVAWPIWVLPVIFLAWINIHGTFIIGIGVLVLYLCAGLYSFQLGNVEALAWSPKQRLQLESVLLLCLAVLPITPYGTKLAVYPFDIAFSQPINLANVIEWKPMPFELPGGKIFLGLLLIAIVLQILFRFRWRLEEVLLAIGATAMACLHVRFILLFVPFFAPVFATMLAKWLPPYKRSIDKYALNAALMAAAVIAMIHYRPTHKSVEDAVSKQYPVEAVKYLKEHPATGKMLNTYGYGGYLVGEGVPTFIDGRGDLFERGGVFGDYVHLTQFKPGAFGVLRNYDISTCLLDRDEPLSTALLESPKWQRVYVDGTSAVYVRR